MIHFKIYDLNREEYIEGSRSAFMTDALNFIEYTLKQDTWHCFEVHKFKRGLGVKTEITVYLVGVKTVNKPLVF